MFSNADNTGARINGTLHVSTDGGQTYQFLTIVDPGSYGYRYTFDHHDEMHMFRALLIHSPQWGGTAQRNLSWCAVRVTERKQHDHPLHSQVFELRHESICVCAQKP